jgi:uncharacterized protein (DUF433 family)
MGSFLFRRLLAATCSSVLRRWRLPLEALVTVGWGVAPATDSWATVLRSSLRTCGRPLGECRADPKPGFGTSGCIPGVCGGKPCIAGHRVRVSDVVVWHEHRGLTAGAIASQAPGLSLAGVHAALAYYYQHLDEIREEMRAERSVFTPMSASPGP